MPEYLVRQEQVHDREFVEALVQSAFKEALHSDGAEHLLVKRLRMASRFIPELSLVATSIDETIVGHILFTPIKIQSPSKKEFQSLALAPVSVLPAFQGCGIGSMLIEHGHQTAKSLGHTSVILLGHPSYYPRFAYRPASCWNIKAPFDVPDEAFMAIELVEGALRECSGTVSYPSEFGLE